MAVMDLVPRTTKDVDVIALAEKSEGPRKLVPPDPLPEALQDSITRVARDYSLAPTWLNTEIASQWHLGRSGLPPAMEEDITWQRFSTLEVGFVGRRSLIALKLFAAADQDPGSVHYQDLINLQPSEAELQSARRWVLAQDAGPAFPDIVAGVIERANADLGRND